MNTIEASTKAVLFAGGLIFLAALVLGAWKYRQMASSDDHLAHPYVDIAHRAALLYSFAIVLIAAFVQLSGLAAGANLAAAFTIIGFFVTALIFDVVNVHRDTVNQFADPLPGTHAYMAAVIVGQIGGWLLLIAGFADGQFT